MRSVVAWLQESCLSDVLTIIMLLLISVFINFFQLSPTKSVLSNWIPLLDCKCKKPNFCLCSDAKSHLMYDMSAHNACPRYRIVTNCSLPRPASMGGYASRQQAEDSTHFCTPHLHQAYQVSVLQQGEFSGCQYRFIIGESCEKTTKSSLRDAVAL